MAGSISPSFYAVFFFEKAENRAKGFEPGNHGDMWYFTARSVKIMLVASASTVLMLLLARGKFECAHKDGDMLMRDTRYMGVRLS